MLEVVEFFRQILQYTIYLSHQKLVEHYITATKLGKLHEAFGSSIREKIDYWIMSDNMEQALNGTNETIILEIISMKLKLCKI